MRQLRTKWSEVGNSEQEGTSAKNIFFLFKILFFLGTIATFSRENSMNNNDFTIRKAKVGINIKSGTQDNTYNIGHDVFS